MTTLLYPPQLLPAHAWRRILTYLAPLELKCIAQACAVSSHVTDWTVVDPSFVLAAKLMTHTAVRQLAVDPDGLTCDSIPPNEHPRSRWTRILLTTTKSQTRIAQLDSKDTLLIRGEESEMSTRQIVPQADSNFAARPPKPSKTMGEVVPVASKTSTLVKLFQRLALARRRRAQQQQLQHRNSWPSARPDTRRNESLARRAQQSLVNAWAALHREASSSKASLLSPPQFLLRTQRRISQSFNLRIVQAVNKDVRRIENHRRSSLTMLEGVGSSSSLSSDSSDDTETDEYPLKMSERLSLSLGRRLSRDAPMLTEGTPLECRVRELVYGLLRNPSTLEGHVSSTFFTKQEDFSSTLPAACRYYLGRVRDTISDLVEFIVAYRLETLGDEFLPFFESHDNQDHDAAFAEALEHAVRRAVEEYFCFSLRYEIRHWSGGAANVDRPSRFRRTLGRWGDLPPTSREFGLKCQDPELATQPQIAMAIIKLQELGTIATPSQKMENLLAACHALGDFIAQGRTAQVDGPLLSPSTRVCLGDADSFLPLLIFVVSRSKLRDAYGQCALLHGLYPFASQHGERMYYLTMYEAALEFIRTHSN